MEIIYVPHYLYLTLALQHGNTSTTDGWSSHLMRMKCIQQVFQIQSISRLEPAENNKYIKLSFVTLNQIINLNNN